HDRPAQPRGSRRARGGPRHGPVHRCARPPGRSRGVRRGSPARPTGVERETSETDVRVEAVLGTGEARIDTSVPFLDHMMTALARYSGIDLTITATGDLRHHLVEDVALTVGAAFAQVIPATAARYGERTVPMDEALVQAVLDAG